jgi:hypothetical protein
MHFLSSVYSVTIPLHFSRLSIVQHQEVTIHIYMQHSRSTDSQLKRNTRTICCTFTLLNPDDEQLQARNM